MATALWADRHTCTHPSWVEFWSNTPTTPEHAEFTAAAARLYPKLPPGAQQAALHTLYTLGKGYAKRYAANAAARREARTGEACEAGEDAGSAA